MSFPAYPSYRDSGVDWLGKVPIHWNLKRLAHYFDERREKCSDTDYPALSVTKGGVVPQLETAAKTDDGDNRKKVLVGDFVINSRSDRKGSSGLSYLDGSVSLINTVLSPNSDIFGIFAHHLFRSGAFQEEYYRYGKGIVADLWSTNFSEMRNILLAIPPSSEQAEIAAFLDRETARIDALIEEQQRLIELLKEKRQAVISHAVTKGLDPTAPMKDSGVEWLGEVPSHWEVRPLKYLINLQSGGTPSKDRLDYWDGSIPWVSAKDLKSDNLVDSQDHISEEAIAGSAASLMPAGSVLVLVRGMMLARTFPVCRAVVPMAINQDLKAIEGKAGVSNHFLAWLLRGTAPETLNRLDEAGHGTKALRMEAWLSMLVPFPPEDEQVAIALTVDKQTEQIDALIDETASAKTLLQERRSALISNAVTGKIDVRGAVETYPKPEPEPA